MTRAPSHDRLAHMADDVRQLCERFHVPVKTRQRAGKTVWVEQRFPPLLTLMYSRLAPGSTEQNNGRRPVPDSREPGPVSTVLDAFGMLLNGTTNPTWRGVHEWRGVFGMPHLDRDPNPIHSLLWWRSTLFEMVGRAPTIAPSFADDLADDMHRWWQIAAHHAGLDLDTLLAGRR